MRNVPGPARSATADYDACVERSRRPKKQGLQARRAEVIDHYQEYQACGGRAHLAPRTVGWGAQDETWQISLYDLTYEGEFLQDIRSDALWLAQDRCLLCSAARPGTLDHFLPKDVFPTLSLLSANLIAACADCNHRKGTLAEADPARQFVHPYLDVIPADVTFLRATVVADGVLSPVFEIADAAGLGGNLLDRLRWQFSELRLNQAYVAESMLFLGERRRDWRGLAEIGWATLEDALRRERDSAVDDTGPNRWKPAFLTALIESPEVQAAPLQLIR